MNPSNADTPLQNIVETTALTPVFVSAFPQQALALFVAIMKATKIKEIRKLKLGIPENKAKDTLIMITTCTNRIRWYVPVPGRAEAFAVGTLFQRLLFGHKFVTTGEALQYPFPWQIQYPIGANRRQLSIANLSDEVVLRCVAVHADEGRC